MNNATKFPSAVSEPKRRNILVDFLIRLATVKPLGTFGGIIVLIFILVAIGGIGSSRIVRSTVIGVKENVYFQAAVALPNIAAPSSSFSPLTSGP